MLDHDLRLHQADLCVTPSLSLQDQRQTECSQGERRSHFKPGGRDQWDCVQAEPPPE